MSATYRIAVADSDAESLQRISECLEKAGHQVVVKAALGSDLIAACIESSPHLIVTDVRLNGVDGLVAVKSLLAVRDVAVLFISSSGSSEEIDAAMTVRPMAYLVKPVNEQELLAEVLLTMDRFQELQQLRQEVAESKQAIQDRKLIERAKGIVMVKKQLTEGAAFQHLQKLARDNRQKLVTVAQAIILADMALEN
jgi:response regulator NasT